MSNMIPNTCAAEYEGNAACCQARPQELSLCACRHHEDETMRDRLSQLVGIEPSEAWCAACLLEEANSSSSSSNRQEEKESFLLEQLLHHDLQGVVDNDRMCAASRDLRRSMQASTAQTVALPETFRLLVQVEAVSNMAVGMEKRLAAGGTNSNPHTRCWKIAYSDGYHNNNNNNNDHTTTTTFTAMEVSPLLNFHGIAGTKVLLKGPLTIRNGVMGWMPANAIVLGGCVDELVQLQQQAMQRAQQRSGHGVDPTIKALIWNNQNMDEQEGKTMLLLPDATLFLLTVG